MSSFAVPASVLVRGIPDSYAGCLRTDQTLAIDVAVARRQHDAYVAALGDLGITVDVLPADPSAPDSCFVEDTAVVLDTVALLTCPGAPSRRGEVPPVGAALASHRRVYTMSAPATLDGGDVLRAGDCLFVGLSTRTNAAGVAQLESIAAIDGIRVIPLQVGGGLHLKSACSLASAALVVVDPAVIGDEARAAFGRAGLTCIDASEPAGANVLALGEIVIVSSAAPRTAARLLAAGLVIRVLDVGEFHKGDGALTCLSLRVSQRGSWST